VWIRQTDIRGKNAVDDSLYIGLEDTSDFAYIDMSPSGVAFDEPAIAETVDYKKTVVPLTPNSSTKRYFYPGNMLDWEISAKVNINLSDDASTGFLTYIRGEIILLPTICSDERFFSYEDENVWAGTQEHYLDVNYAMRVFFIVTCEHSGLSNKFAVRKIAGWSWGPQIEWGASENRTMEEVLLDNPASSHSCALKLTHRVPSSLLKTATVGMYGGRGSPDVRLLMQAPEIDTSAGYSVPVKWDLDLAQRPKLRSGELPTDPFMDNGEYRAVAAFPERYGYINYVLVNGPVDLPMEWEGGYIKNAPFFADIRYVRQKDNRGLTFSATNPSFSENLAYNPEFKLSRDSLVPIPYNCMNRAWIRVTRRSPTRACTASVTDVNIKTAAPGTL